MSGAALLCWSFEVFRPRNSRQCDILENEGRRQKLRLVPDSLRRWRFFRYKPLSPALKAFPSPSRTSPCPRVRTSSSCSRGVLSWWRWWWGGGGGRDEMCVCGEPLKSPAAVVLQSKQERNREGTNEGGGGGGRGAVWVWQWAGQWVWWEGPDDAHMWSHAGRQQDSGQWWDLDDTTS